MCKPLPMFVVDLRKELGLSQEAFAALLGLKSKGQISQIERGCEEPSVRVALAIEQLSSGRIPAAQLNADVALVVGFHDERERGNCCHEDNLPATAALGAENPAENVSRTNLLSSSGPSPTTLRDTTPAHQVAETDTIKGTAGNNAVVGSSAGNAGNRSAHGNVDQGAARLSAAGIVQLGSEEVGQTDLDPALAPSAWQGLYAQAVGVTDIDDRAAETVTRAQLGRHRPAIRDAFAGVGRGRPSDGDEQKGHGGESDHAATLAPERHRGAPA